MIPPENANISTASREELIEIFFSILKYSWRDTEMVGKVYEETVAPLRAVFETSSIEVLRSLTRSAIRTYVCSMRMEEKTTKKTT